MNVTLAVGVHMVFSISSKGLETIPVMVSGT